MIQKTTPIKVIIVKTYASLENHLITFLQHEVKKAGFSNVIVGISGGVDSAVVAVLAQKAFKENFLALMLPSSTSSKASLEHATELCEKFAIRVERIPIGALAESYFHNDPHASKLRIGNFCARMRMAVLYDIAAREHALVLGTSNKSEILLGYGTIFGDLACALNPIGELLKTEIFAFAEHLGVPSSILNKAPSADLWEGQKDEEEFGFSYAQIDKVLLTYLKEHKSKEELLALGFDATLVSMIFERMTKNAFKGKLPLIADISAIH
ncbi:NAD+ synthetase [Sulfurospirillum deleyianum DSM 6946]|uniref:NH(3)-dependent NAD(+) synthetase n=1 Tax=Sulfurospirillum deleyianum (strain ATCC 51133 / DSM 6946 / 5175) TaxID=525898 RepID=D1B2P8_SULD5|nr:NAD+ synthetase [Sulfurospirillum deleyianum DSM 6946]